MWCRRIMSSNPADMPSTTWAQVPYRIAVERRLPRETTSMTPTDIPRENAIPRRDKEPYFSTRITPSRVDMPERALYAIASIIGRTSQQKFESQKQQDQTAQRLSVIAHPTTQELSQDHAQSPHQSAEHTEQTQGEGGIRRQNAEGKPRRQGIQADAEGGDQHPPESGNRSAGGTRFPQAAPQHIPT